MNLLNMSIENQLFTHSMGYELNIQVYG